MTNYAARAKAPNTLKAYRIDWADFSEWCALHRLESQPAAPRSVVPDRSGQNAQGLDAVSPPERHLAGHQAAGYVTPTTDAEVRLVFQGIRRTLGSAPNQKNAAITTEVRAMVEPLSPTSLIGVRDRALLLVGFAGAFRRSELVATPKVAASWSFDVADATFGADGLIMQLRRSKTDQEDEGRPERVSASFPPRPGARLVESVDLPAWRPGWVTCG